MHISIFFLIILSFSSVWFQIQRELAHLGNKSVIHKTVHVLIQSFIISQKFYKYFVAILG